MYVKHSNQVPPTERTKKEEKTHVTTMEITKANFEELLPSIRDAIQCSSFIAYDCELTGLVASNSHNSCAVDSLSTRFDKTRAATTLAISQFDQIRQKGIQFAGTTLTN